MFVAWVLSFSEEIVKSTLDFPIIPPNLTQIEHPTSYLSVSRHYDLFLRFPFKKKTNLPLSPNNNLWEKRRWLPIHIKEYARDVLYVTRNKIISVGLLISLHQTSNMSTVNISFQNSNKSTYLQSSYLLNTENCKMPRLRSLLNGILIGLAFERSN